MAHTGSSIGIPAYNLQLKLGTNGILHTRPEAINVKNPFGNEDPDPSYRIDFTIDETFTMKNVFGLEDIEESYTLRKLSSGALLNISENDLRIKNVLTFGIPGPLVLGDLEDVDDTSKTEDMFLVFNLANNQYETDYVIFGGGEY